MWIDTSKQKLEMQLRSTKHIWNFFLDGDADRIIMCDEKSNIIDGDQIIAALATRWKNKRDA